MHHFHLLIGLGLLLGLGLGLECRVRVRVRVWVTFRVRIRVRVRVGLIGLKGSRNVCVAFRSLSNNTDSTAQFRPFRSAALGHLKSTHYNCLIIAESCKVRLSCEVRLDCKVRLYCNLKQRIDTQYLINLILLYG